MSEVDGCGVETPVAESVLDMSNGDTGFEKMESKGMAKTVRTVRRAEDRMDEPGECARVEAADRGGQVSGGGSAGGCDQERGGPRMIEVRTVGLDFVHEPGGSGRDDAGDAFFERSDMEEDGSGQVKCHIGVVEVRSFGDAGTSEKERCDRHDLLRGRLQRQSRRRYDEMMRSLLRLIRFKYRFELRRKRGGCMQRR